jgi:excisionase family DNA binding protein
MFLSTKETCEVLKLSRWTVMRMIRSGELEAVKGAARNAPLRIKEESIRRYIDRNTVHSGGAA